MDTNRNMEIESNKNMASDIPGEPQASKSVQWMENPPKNMANDLYGEPQASKSIQWVDNLAFGENTKNELDLNLDCSLDSLHSDERKILSEEIEQGIARKEN